MRKRKIPKKGSTYTKALVIKMILLIISLAYFILIYCASYNNFKPVNINAIKLVKKNSAEYRVSVENASGLIISYQNKNIYNSLKNNVLKSTDNEAKKNQSKFQNSESALISIRDNKLFLKDVLTQLNESEYVFISCGFASTKAATDKKLKRLLMVHPELIPYQIKIYKISEDRYKIKTAIAMDREIATKISLKIKKSGEECYVEQ